MTRPSERSGPGNDNVRRDAGDSPLCRPSDTNSVGIRMFRRRDGTRNGWQTGIRRNAAFGRIGDLAPSPSAARRCPRDEWRAPAEKELIMHSRNYRYYCLDSTGRLRSSEWLEAGSDVDAVEQIVARHSAAMWEIWRGERLVAKQSPTHLSA